MATKRHWWSADERFKKVHRNLRLNYDQAAAAAESAANMRVLKAEEVFNKRAEAIRQQFETETQRIEQRAEQLTSEIARVRLECGPSHYGARFMMYVTMDEKFMLNARDLKEMGPYVVKRLVCSIEREFAQIDFTRMKPIIPGSPYEKPHYRIDSIGTVRP